MRKIFQNKSLLGGSSGFLGLFVVICKTDSVWSCISVLHHQEWVKGAQWLSGRVLDSRPRVRASPASLCFGPWARPFYPRQTCPCLTERLLMGRKESNQTKPRMSLHSKMKLWDSFSLEMTQNNTCTRMESTTYSGVNRTFSISPVCI